MHSSSIGKRMGLRMRASACHGSSSAIMSRSDLSTIQDWIGTSFCDFHTKLSRQSDSSPVLQIFQ